MRYSIILFLLKIPFFVFSQADLTGQARERYMQACSNLVKKDFEKAIENGKLCLEASRKIHYPDGEIHALNIIGVAYARQWKHDKAFQYFDSASKRISGKTDKKLIMQVYGNLGLQFDTLKEYKKSIENLLVAAKLAQAIGDYQYQEMTYRALAGSYYGLNDLANPKNNKNKGKWADATFYAEKCTDLLKKHKELEDRYLDYTY